jgi:putative alpha-1,2-mannosidase
MNPGSGFIQPRFTNGLFLPCFDPSQDSLPSTSSCYVKNPNSGPGGGGDPEFTEGTAYTYSWNIPYNVSTLIKALGGASAVIDRLNSYFTELNADIFSGGSPYAYLGNEPSQGNPYIYLWAGYPSGAQSVARRAELELYTVDPGGLPGNDDTGETSAWYVWNAIGLYPAIQATGGVVINSPLFTGVEVQLAGGRMLDIMAPAASDSTPYVVNVSLNGQVHPSTWLGVSELNQAKNTLAFNLSDQPQTSPGAWGTNGTDAPPSFTAGETPVLGYLDSPTVTLGVNESTSFNLNLRNLASAKARVAWTAQVPPGIILSSDKGALSVGQTDVSQALGVIAESGAVPGNYLVTFYLQVQGLPAGEIQPPTVTLEVTVP